MSLLRASAFRALRSFSSVSGAPQAVAAAEGVATRKAEVTVPTPSALEAEGKNVENPWNHYEVENTDNIDVDYAKRTAIFSQVAEDYEGRKVIIYQEGQSAATSGVRPSKTWRIAFDHPRRKWSNQLMGYLSSKDTLNAPANVIQFDTPEEAIFFAERNGWDYAVSTSVSHPAIATDSGSVGNQYSYNILPLVVSAKMKEAEKPFRAKKIFEYDASPVQTGVSTWINFRHSDYGPDKWRPRKDIKQTEEAWTGPAWPGKKEISD